MLKENVNSFNQKLKMLHLGVLIHGKSDFVILTTQRTNYITGEKTGYRSVHFLYNMDNSVVLAFNLSLTEGTDS
jgi:hypothetical protein